jgi:hypothetical protein
LKKDFQNSFLRVGPINIDAKIFKIELIGEEVCEEDRGRGPGVYELEGRFPPPCDDSSRSSLGVKGKKSHPGKEIEREVSTFFLQSWFLRGA